MKSSFNCIYLLEDNEQYILEIRRTDLPDDSEKGDLYRWLYINKESFIVNQLWFISSNVTQGTEERFFDQGHLRFDREKGTFIEKSNSTPYTLLNKTGEKLPQQLLVTIEKHLKE